MKKRILLLTGHYGAGHQQVAKAIDEVIKWKNEGYEATVVDIGSYAYPKLSGISRSFFIKGVGKFPNFYNYLYQKTRTDNHLSTLFKKMNQLSLWKVLKLITEIQPHIVVSTFPLASGAMAYLKEHGFTNVKSVTIITDYTVHSAWIYPFTDHYIVGSTDVREGLIRFGVKSSRISVTGIPIHPKFANTYNGENIKKRYGLKERLPIVLVMSGGYGHFSKYNPILTSFETLPMNVQLLIVCGYNKKLKVKFEEQFSRSKHDVQVFGFIDYIDELMAIADAMVTKAGGLTVSEAIALQTPMLLYGSLGGQEEDNSQYLVQKKMAERIEHQKDFVPLLQNILQGQSIGVDPRMANRQKQAVFLAVRSIVELIEQSDVLYYA